MAHAWVIETILDVHLNAPDIIDERFEPLFGDAQVVREIDTGLLLCLAHQFGLSAIARSVAQKILSALIVGAHDVVRDVHEREALVLLIDAQHRKVACRLARLVVVRKPCKQNIVRFVLLSGDELFLHVLVVERHGGRSERLESAGSDVEDEEHDHANSYDRDDDIIATATLHELFCARFARPMLRSALIDRARFNLHLVDLGSLLGERGVSPSCRRSRAARLATRCRARSLIAQMGLA